MEDGCPVVFTFHTMMRFGKDCTRVELLATFVLVSVQMLVVQPIYTAAGLMILLSLSLRIQLINTFYYLYMFT